mmetsp:Transcript_20930/g.53205  ORF Transcript_20930/g.53205 Transcript_20930/m.53205 type:complete len:363 (+) Transcript_20930:35-1123(+)
MKRTCKLYTTSMSRCYWRRLLLRAPSRRAASRTLLQLSYLDCGTGEEAGVGLLAGAAGSAVGAEGREVIREALQRGHLVGRRVRRGGERRHHVVVGRRVADAAAARRGAARCCCGGAHPPRGGGGELLERGGICLEVALALVHEVGVQAAAAEEEQEEEHEHHRAPRAAALAPAPAAAEPDAQAARDGAGARLCLRLAAREPDVDVAGALEEAGVAQLQRGRGRVVEVVPLWRRRGRRRRRATASGLRALFDRSGLEHPSQLGRGRALLRDELDLVRPLLVPLKDREAEEHLSLVLGQRDLGAHAGLEHGGVRVDRLEGVSRLSSKRRRLSSLSSSTIIRKRLERRSGRSPILIEPRPLDRR